MINFKGNYIKVLILVLLVITLIVACSKDEVLNESAEPIATEEVEKETPKKTPAEVTAMPETTSIPEVTVIAETPTPSESVVPEEEIYISQKNTNGNLNNFGLVAPDRSTSSHLVSVGSSVYKFDPVLRTSEILFSLDGGGRATYINATEDWIYYINSSDHWAYRVNQHDLSQTEAIIQEKCVYLSKDQMYVFHSIEEEGYTSFNTWYEDDGNTYQIRASSSNTSFSSSRVYYLNASAFSIQMCGTNGAGKSAIVYLDGIFDKLNEMFAYDRDTLLVVGTKDGKTELYNYIDNSFNKIGSADTLPPNIRNINCDYTHFYFIGGSGDGVGIYRMDQETFETEKLLDVSGNTTFLNVLNNWIYFGDVDSSNIYKYKIGEAKESIME